MERDNNIRFALDLLWFRYGHIAGGVSVVLNLLNGLLLLDNDFECYLIITRDNEKLFSKYIKDQRFHTIRFKANSSNRQHTLLLQNTKAEKELERNHFKRCIEPDNYIPFLTKGRIKYLTVIHDLQIRHYPNNASILMRRWININLRHAISNSYKLIAISNYTKQDIIKEF